MPNPVHLTRAQILAELYETGVLVERETDEKIIKELTANSDFGAELRALGDADPDLIEE